MGAGVLDELFSSLIEAVYSAALLPGGWADWTARITTSLGGIATGFTVWDKGNAGIRCQIMHHPDEAKLARYIEEEIWRIDPQMPLLDRLDATAVFSDVECLDREDPPTRDYLRYQAAISDMGHFISFGTPLSREVKAGFSIHRRVADGVTPRQELEKLAVIAPHAHRAMQLGFLHDGLLERAFWDGLLAERTEPALLLDGRGRVLRVTPAAERLLGEGASLDIAGGRLTAGDPVSDGALQGAIGRAVRWNRPIAGTVRIARPPSAMPLILSGYPLTRAVRALAPVEAAALVVIVDPSAAPPIRSVAWRQAFGLTPRETALAEALVGGHSLETAAAVLEMSRNTARAHLRSLFAKSGCTRQVELVRLLGRIG